MAKKYKTSPENIFIRFLMNANVIPLVGTISENHMKDHMEKFNFKEEDFLDLKKKLEYFGVFIFK
jgi:diketogulonate reductase-like aldo/keto reductase